VRLAAIEDVAGPPGYDKSIVLLALYRYEALAKLSPSGGNVVVKELEDLFNDIVKMPDADAKTFETVAGVCVSHRFSRICSLLLAQFLLI